MGVTCDENCINGVEDIDDDGNIVYICIFLLDWIKKGTFCNDSDECSYGDQCGCVGGGTVCIKESLG